MAFYKKNITVIDRRDYTYDKEGQEAYKKVDEQLKKHDYLLVSGHRHRTNQKLKRFVTDGNENIVFDTNHFSKNTYNNINFVLSNACVQADN